MRRSKIAFAGAVLASFAYAALVILLMFAIDERDLQRIAIWLSGSFGIIGDLIGVVALALVLAVGPMFAWLGGASLADRLFGGDGRVP